ncbi:hypothetical protein PHMEG_0003743 [Phytophthora megakarya]|uniref:Uncharacterized protein n=1 Tax=Phytophthora megakarya TaxID=4795 RepID=A0A225WVR2_9STRA|nr:hypothetical protein PHMEG_0003743 [Phytophthora megakarya]
MDLLLCRFELVYFATRSIQITHGPRCTTIQHVDSIYSIVKQRHPVFVFGISDTCGKYFPMVYFCTSQCQGCGVAWCFVVSKRIIWELFLVRFTPQFIMMEADNAQNNATTEQLPGAKIFMCWFEFCPSIRRAAKPIIDQ